MEINELQHPDFIWTWKSSSRSKKVSLWIPYLQSIERLPKGGSDRYTFTFNGGEVTCHLKELDFLMLYGASGQLPIEFLDRLCVYGIPLIIHRRNMPCPLVFHPAIAKQNPDVLTKQILARENQIKRCYVARTLIEARIKQMKGLITIPAGRIVKLRNARSISEIRAIEAQITKRYWAKYFRQLSLENATRRDSDNPVSAALDACSFFMYGVLLRWVLFHKLSPCHGYLHEPTSYASLCYDLLEPYRYIIEASVSSAYLTSSDKDAQAFTARSINQLKNDLEETCYVPATRQTVAKKALLHGVVLALRAYLLGEVKRFNIPQAGDKKGGRPIKAGFRMPGSR